MGIVHDQEAALLPQHAIEPSRDRAERPLGPRLHRLGAIPFPATDVGRGQVALRDQLEREPGLAGSEGAEHDEHRRVAQRVPELRELGGAAHERGRQRQAEALQGG